MPDLDTKPALVLPTHALTLWQPWAWLVAHGHKPIENRPEGFSQKSFRGPFWIHAGKYNPSGEEQEAALDACVTALGGKKGRTLWALMDQAMHAGEMPLGAIVGRATITGIIPPSSAPPPANLFAARQPTLVWFRGTPVPPVPWHFPDQYGFLLVEAAPLKRPVPCRGYQGFWRVPEDVLARCKEAA